VSKRCASVDAFLVTEALAGRLSVKLHIVEDGEQALSLTARMDADESIVRPDLILLDYQSAQSRRISGACRHPAQHSLQRRSRTGNDLARAPR
jgi:CheY-like chemotaxis protein